MAQPTVVGESGKVNGKAHGATTRATNPTPPARYHHATDPARPFDTSPQGSVQRRPLQSRQKDEPSSAPTRHDLSRRYTEPGVDPLDEVVWERGASVITNPDGSVVFKMEGAEIPARWTQLATDIVVSKYFRKAGLHGETRARARRASARSCTASRTRIREAGEALRRLLRDEGGRRRVRGRALLPAGQPVRRVQLAGVVQLRPLARVRHRRARAATGRGTRQTRRGRPRRRTPTSARSARRASSRRSTTT